MYYLTGIQHTKSGDIVIPTLGYENYGLQAEVQSRNGLCYI